MHDGRQEDAGVYWQNRGLADPGFPVHRKHRKKREWPALNPNEM